MVVSYYPMTPSAEFAARLSKVSDDEIISESEACRRAGVSKGIVAAARSRGGKINWNAVFALTDVLVKVGYRREWLLFGEKPRLAGDALLGDVVRLGPGAAVAGVPGVVAPRALKKSRKKTDGAHANEPPAASQNGRRAKRVGSSNVDNR